MVNEKELIKTIENNDVSKLNKLLTKGLNPNEHTTLKGFTPIHLAVISGRLEMVEILLQHGGDPNVLSKSSRELPELLTPLQTAIISRAPEKYDITRTLIRYGANVNLFKSNSDIGMGPPVIMAIAKKDYTMVKLLLDNGADVNAYIIGKDGCQVKPIGQAAYVGDVKIVELLIQYGAKVEESNDNLSTPYHLSAYKGYLDILKFLFNIYPAPNIVGCYKTTPLFSAALSNLENLDVIKFLVEAGADVNFIDMMGNSVLYYALRQKKSTVVSYLTEHGGRLITGGKEAR
ncbi:hypothetical protein HS7_12950 [Sulfolobales archaeon HS-7]|nr:hypothetical protein HS7_12950 [Sulfolobales archaeon HS-7]